MPSLLVSFLKNLISRLPPPQEKTLQSLSQHTRKANSFSVPSIKSPIEEGRRQLEEGNWMEALTLFHLAVQKNSTNNWAWHGKGDAFQLLGDYSNARLAYEKAVSFSPQTGLHYGGLSNALKALNHIQKSNKMWKKALALDPSLTWMRSNSS